MNPLQGWVSSLNSDRDQDGCADATEDDDDDGDGVLDDIDSCKLSIRVTFDHDSDGCMDDFDLDDDDDGVLDTRDQCAHGAIGWTSNDHTDIDGDGCWDTVEDMSLPRGIVETIQDSPILMSIVVAVAFVAMAGATIETRRRNRNRKRVNDSTREVIRSMEDSETGAWGVKTETIDTPVMTQILPDNHLQNLIDTGYSPEVARAIIQSELAIREKMEE